MVFYLWTWTDVVRSYILRQSSSDKTCHLASEHFPNYNSSLFLLKEKIKNKTSRLGKMSSFHSHPLGIVTLIAHFIQCVSALIVLGITAWAVQGTKTLTVIFALVVVSIPESQKSFKWVISDYF